MPSLISRAIPLAVLSLGMGCGGHSDSPSPAVDPLIAREGTMRDAEGREWRMRGFNARVEGLFDVTFDDGRAALEPIPPFGREDCRFMAREMGMNLLRLPINWSGIEPERGRYGEAYIDRVAALARACHEEGVETLVDLHQDAYSKHIGEDGAPLWAIVPPPESLLEGPLTDLDQRRTSTQVLRAFRSFFDNAEGLQEAYAAMAAHLADRLGDTPGVIGLEIMNEPVLLGDDALLDAFHRRVAAAVRDIRPEMTLFFEPNSLRNRAGGLEVAHPFDVADSVYSPHVYPNFVRDDPVSVAPDVANAAQEAADHEAPLFIGEFGAGPSQSEWLDELHRRLDEAKASWALWLFEEWSQGQWGLYDMDEGPARGALRRDFARRIARPFPQAIDGRLESMTYHPETRRLEVRMAEAGNGPHVLGVPALLYPEGVRVFCDGGPSAFDSLPGRIAVRCTGRELTLEADDE